MSNINTKLINFLFAFIAISVLTPFIDMWLYDVRFSDMDIHYFIQKIFTNILGSIAFLVINKLFPSTTIIKNKEQDTYSK